MAQHKEKDLHCLILWIINHDLTHLSPAQWHFLYRVKATCMLSLQGKHKMFERDKHVILKGNDIYVSGTIYGRTQTETCILFCYESSIIFSIIWLPHVDVCFPIWKALGLAISTAFWNSSSFATQANNELFIHAYNLNTKLSKLFSGFSG